MKYILFLLIFLVSCTKENTLDSANYKNISAEIICTRGCFAKDLKIKKDGEKFIIDVHNLKPWKVDFCNVDGGEVELALGVYKKTPFDKSLAKRCFLYNIDFKNKKLIPKLRISRLHNPITDFNLCDIDGDGRDEIISIEKNIKGEYLFGVYDWTNFSFERNYSSIILKDEPIFLDKEKKVEVRGNKRELFLEGDEIKWK